MNKHTKWIAAALSGSELIAGPAFAQNQALSTEVTVQTQADEDNAQRTRSFSRVLGSGETSSGTSVETIEMDETAQVYNKEVSRTTFGGQQISSSINDEIRVDGITATRDYDRTVTNIPI